MQDLSFMTQLQKAGMQLCLHGDVHESRTGLFGYRQPGIDAKILGAGCFGSEAEGRPESTPRLYNMLEVTIDPKTKQHTSVRVHTREQKKAEQAWQGFYGWPSANGGRLPYFDIELTTPLRLAHRPRLGLPRTNRLRMVNPRLKCCGRSWSTLGLRQQSRPILLRSFR